MKKKTENSQPNEKPTKTVDSGELISNGNELSKPTESKTTESTTLHKKESSASEKLQQFSGVQNSFSAENQKKKEEAPSTKNVRANEDIKLVDRIDIDKDDKDGNLEKIRENNSKIENGQVPQKERKGFCTNCLLF